MNHSRLVLLTVPFWVTSALGGAPLLAERCNTDLGPVAVRYEPAVTRYFAEARVVPPVERAEAQRRRVPVASIIVNPTLYYLGQRTQQWLFLRQCVHIQKQHLVAVQGERGLRPEDEEESDCAALDAMIAQDKASTATLRMSIESDLDRIVRMNRWSEVLPGPQRRVAFERCSK